jgi:hypothetical protein
MGDEKFIKHRKAGAEILQLVLDGELSPVQGKDRWPDSKEDSMLEAAFHMLCHFEDDDDIRTRDPKYADWQVGELTKMIFQLKGESLSQK